ncbi:hypothetical protein HU200_018444 [Digitaria exilis]|uniref:Uncharacterized protein n=1 Tax=Digitaria exilis TaxID=1010633 RepID=A0A835F466_9POAL|nr:hypothetical protein HU200_018444 [Digitaria exilis]
MEFAISAAQWVLGKALGAITDGVLEAWAASRNLGLNIDELKMELLYAQGMLDNAQGWEIRSPALRELLLKLQQLAYSADDALDELDYFRIHDHLYGTFDAANSDPRGFIQDLNRHLRHTATAVVVQQLAGTISSTNQPDATVGGDTRKFTCCSVRVGKHFPCCSVPPVQEDADQTSVTMPLPETVVDSAFPKLEFNRVDMSQRLKATVDELRPLCAKVSVILNMELLDSNRKAAQKIAAKISAIRSREDGHAPILHRSDDDGKTRPITTSYISAPHLHGREAETRIILDIEQTLVSKRFMLVLDDMWDCGNNNDGWDRLLAPFRKGQTKGNMILVTTRSPKLAQIVKTTDATIELEGLAEGSFREFFMSCLEIPTEKCDAKLLDIGEKIMKRLKGSPLAAKTVGPLLRCNLDPHYWKRVLDSKEWELQTGDNDIMPALKLSYDFLPFHLQRCFSFCALFPQDYGFDSKELIHWWIGLDILQSIHQNRSMEDIGQSNLNDLVKHGFMKQDTRNERYYIHDLLHDLGLKVASRDCLSINYSNVRSVEILPSVRHLSVIIKDLNKVDDGLTVMEYISELEIVRTRLKIEKLQTLMVFGTLDESFTDFFGDLIRKAKGLRVVHLEDMRSDIKFPVLYHLRYLSLGTFNFHAQLPSLLSRFYHLRILDLQRWYGRVDLLLRDTSNLRKLRHFGSGYLHSRICNVGKLQSLQELIFTVNKESTGFGLEQLEKLNELRELELENLERIHIPEEATGAKLIDKKYLQKLTLAWNFEMPKNRRDSEGLILEKLEPQRNLQELRIRGHGSRFCPTWLGSKLCLKDLKSLHLAGVEWEDLSSLRHMGLLRELTLKNMPTLKALPPIPWTQTLRSVEIKEAGSSVPEYLEYTKSSAKAKLRINGRHLYSLDEKVLVFNNLTDLDELSLTRCPPLASKHLQLLESLKHFYVSDSQQSVLPVNESEAEWQLPVEDLCIHGCKNNWKELSQALSHFRSTMTQIFCSLKRLELKAIKGLEKWIMDDILVSHLEVLRIEDCCDLLGIFFADNIYCPPREDQDGKIYKFANLQELVIRRCPRLISFPPIPWTQTLCSVEIEEAGSSVPQYLAYTKSPSKVVELRIHGKHDDSYSLDEKVLVFNNLTDLEKLHLTRCPPLASKHLQLLASLKHLYVSDSQHVFVPPVNESEAEWQLPVENLCVDECENPWKELSQLLSHFPKLSKLTIRSCRTMTQIGVVAAQQQSTATTVRLEQQIAEVDDAEDGLLLLPAHLSESLRMLTIHECKEVSLVPSPGSRGGIQALHSLQILEVIDCPKFLSAYKKISFSSSCYPFPSSLEKLELYDVVLQTLQPLANLASLTRLYISNCEQGLRSDGMWTLVSHGQLRELGVAGAPRFFIGSDTVHSLEDEDQVQRLRCSSKLQELYTYDSTGFLAAPICTILSSSLIKLTLCGDDQDQVLGCFTREQEMALELLTSLQDLKLNRFSSLQCLPSGLQALTNLKSLKIFNSNSISSLPIGGLPNSLQELELYRTCRNLNEQCRKFVEDHPRIKLRISFPDKGTKVPASPITHASSHAIDV